MSLQEYLSNHGNAKKLADKAKFNAPEISRFKTGKRAISFENAARIEYATDGLIKMETLLDDPMHRMLAAYIRGNHVPQQTAA